MIVPPVSIMPLVPVTAGRFVMTDTILFVVPLFAMGIFRRFGLLSLRSGLWTTIRDMPLRIYRSEGPIVTPESAVFTHLLQSARFSVTCCWVQRVGVFGHEAALLMHCLQGVHFISTRRRVQNVSFAGNNAAAFTHCRQSAQFSLACRWINANRSWPACSMARA
jgi:hypothetical protein